MNQIYSTTSAMISVSSCGRISRSHAARSVPSFLRHELDDDPIRVSGIRFIRRFGEVGSRTEREEAQASPLACNLGFVPFVRPRHHLLTVHIFQLGTTKVLFGGVTSF